MFPTFPGAAQVRIEPPELSVVVQEGMDDAHFLLEVG